jgi:hypothetical protein
LPGAQKRAQIGLVRPVSSISLHIVKHRNRDSHQDPNNHDYHHQFNQREAFLVPSCFLDKFKHFTTSLESFVSSGKFFPTLVIPTDLFFRQKETNFFINIANNPLAKAGNL